uniref:Immunogenic miracidial antigen 8I n=1 Tax=Schistosoma japonicum TaxID=6182 RepID=C1LHC1_SCHJA|nr:Immunogenic miracidial antigen 8I' [Schistosoma japonicum]
MELVSMIFLCVILFENVLAQPMQHVIPGDQVISTGQHMIDSINTNQLVIKQHSTFDHERIVIHFVDYTISI